MATASVPRNTDRQNRNGTEIGRRRPTMRRLSSSCCRWRIARSSAMAFHHGHSVGRKKNGECSGREFFCRVLCGFQLCAVPWAKFSFWIQKKTRNATRLETLQINLLQASSLIRLMLGDSSFLFYIYFMNNYACFHIPELNRRWFVEGIRFCPCCVSMQTISFTCTPGRLLTVSVTQQLTYATWMREKGGIFPPDKESKHRVYSGVWPSVSTSSTGDLRILLHGQTRTHSHSPGRNFLGKATAECCVC